MRRRRGYMRHFEEYGSDEPRFGWAVGLFDGEGSIGIYRNYVHLRLSMTDPETVDFFQQVVGEGILSWQHRRDHRKPCLQWALHRQDQVRGLLYRILPLLVTKRKRAIIALELMKRSRTQSQKKRLMEEFKATAVRGRRRPADFNPEVMRVQRMSNRELSRFGRAATTEWRRRRRNISVMESNIRHYA